MQLPWTQPRVSGNRVRYQNEGLGYNDIVAKNNIPTLQPKVLCQNSTSTPIPLIVDMEMPSLVVLHKAINAHSPAGFGKITIGIITNLFTQAVLQLEGTVDPNLSPSSPEFDPLKALFYGIRTGLPTIVSLLLSPPYSVDPNSVLVASPCQDQDDAQTKRQDSGNDEKFKGKTALHIAILQEEPVIVSILLKAGADPIAIAEPHMKYTPFVLALCKGHKEIVQLMLDGFLKPTTEAGRKRHLAASHVAQDCMQYAVLYAATSGNVDVVRMVLERGFPVDTRSDDTGRSALVYAAELGAVDVVRTLAELTSKSKKGQDDDEHDKGHDGEEEYYDDDRADLYIGTRDNETLLSVAMVRNQRGVIRELVRLGVDLDVPWTENHRTALSLAAEQDIDGMVDLLLDLGADPDIPDDKGRTALHYAISSGREGNVKQLVYRGADAGIDGKTAQQCSIERIRNVDVAPAVLFKKAAEEGRLGEMKRLDSRYAAKNGYIEMLQWLLLPKDQPYCPVDYQDDAGHTPLWWAAWYGHEDAVQTLLDAGANPELEDETGMMPTMAAEQKGWSNIVVLLGGPGLPGDLGPRDFDKDTTSDSKQEDGGNKSQNKCWRCSAQDPLNVFPHWQDLEHNLFVAVTHGHVTTAALVLDMGTHVNCKNSSGRTPLMVAATKGDGSMLELLLRFGEASLELVNNLGQTALFEAASFGNDEAIRILLGYGASLTTKDHLGRTPLMAAAFHEHEKAANALIESGASIDWADYEGRTALNHAASSGSLSLVKLLLSKGAQVDTPDEDGHTPLCSASQCGKPQVVQVLLQAGACLSRTDRNGKTALLLAAECGHESTVKFTSRLGLRRGSSMQQRPDTIDACMQSKTHHVHRFDNIMHLLSRAVSSKGAAESHESPRLGHLAPDCSPYYEYRSLSSPTSIRLLELHPAETESDILSFTLFELDLDKFPYYETLSYEWGEPAASVTALCNGKPILLTPNLKQVMTRIRSSLPRPTPSPNSAATNQGRILWIDAVCINQASLRERSHQVSMMRRIYYDAESTIFHLGPSNSRSASAVKNISLLSRQFDILSREVPGWWPLCYDVHQVPDTIYLDKIIPLWEAILSDPNCAAGLLDLFGRSYFTRAWIVQEILLSRDGTAILSNPPNSETEEFSIPWRSLLHALWAIGFGARTLHGYRPARQGLRLSGIHVPTFTSPERNKTGFQSRYAATGEGSRVQSGSLTVQQVYTNAMRYFLLSDGIDSGRLEDMGRYMRPNDKHRLPGSPSWVPDWSTPMGAIKPSTAYRVGHLLDGDIDIKMPPTPPDTQNNTVQAKLVVNGVILDRVAQVVHLRREMPVHDRFKLVTLMLHFDHDKTSLFDLYPQMTSLTEPKPITYLAALRDAITPEDKLHTPEQTRNILGFLLSRIIDDEEFPSFIRDQLAEQRRRVMECATTEEKVVDLGTGELAVEEFLVEEYSWMERQVWRGDLVITSRGGFGITNGLDVADKGMVVALVGGADEVYLLRSMMKKTRIKAAGHDGMSLLMWWICGI
ncbi:Ankyrin repeat-containing domain protein [Rhypophila sp. PSN 637]